MNEPKKPYRLPVVRSVLEGVLSANPTPPKVLEPAVRAWTVSTWLVICGALVLGSCGGSTGAALAFLLWGRW